MEEAGLAVDLVAGGRRRSRRSGPGGRCHGGLRGRVGGLDMQVLPAALQVLEVVLRLPEVLGDLLVVREGRGVLVLQLVRLGDVSLDKSLLKR